MVSVFGMFENVPDSKKKIKIIETCNRLKKSFKQVESLTQTEIIKK